jgi:hypothetical protein
MQPSVYVSSSTKIVSPNCQHIEELTHSIILTELSQKKKKICDSQVISNGLTISSAITRNKQTHTHKFLNFS